jgi:hypothetical protein
VQDGLFQVELDFGAGAFGADPRWLEIVVDGTALSPRQAINPAPVALYSLDSDGGGAPSVWSVNGTATYYDGGNVGVGYTNPPAPLTVRSAGRYAPFINNGFGDFYIGDGDIGFSIGVATAGGGRGVTRLWTNGGENRIKLGSAAFGDVLTVVGDRVGIGTGNAVPGNDLDINGSLRVRDLGHGDTQPRQVRVEADGDLVAVTGRRDIMIAPVEFLPVDQDVGFQRGDSFRITGGDDIARAGVQLPDGARVMQMRVWLQDTNSGRDLTVRLQRCLPGTVPLVCNTLAQITSSGAVSNSVRSFSDASIAFPTIDNATFYYRLEVNPEGSDWNGFSIDGVRIRVDET